MSRPVGAKHTRMLRIQARSAKTTIAVGDESARNPRSVSIRAKPRSGATGRATHNFLTPLRGFFVLPSCPWVPRGLVTHGYGRSDATHPSVRLFVKDGMRMVAGWQNSTAGSHRSLGSVLLRLL